MKNTFLLFLLLLSVSSFGQINTGLIAHYPLNGNTNDIGGSSFNGVLSGATGTTDRYQASGQALDFDGINDKVNLSSLGPKFLTIMDTFSLAFWMYIPDYTNSGNKDMEIFTLGTGGESVATNVFQLQVTKTGSMLLKTESGNGTNHTLTLETKTTVKKWTHYVLAFKNDSVYYYRNGLIIKKTKYTKANTTCTNLYLGCWDGTTQYLDGKLDDLRLYDKPLTSTEAFQLYQYPTPMPNPSSPASNVVAKDIADNKNGLDLEVSFNKASNESLVSEYRIIAVKSSKAAAFDTATANNLTSGNYEVVSPTGANIVKTFTATTKDSDGDLIANNIEYKAFVLSVADGTIANRNILSSPSNALTLETFVYADTVSNIIASDIGDNLNGTDLEVSFNKAVDETKIKEYRMIAVKSSAAASFNLTAANALAIGNYEVVAPTGSNITKTFTNASKDSDGDLITINTPYKIFVLSVADGVIANTNSISNPSNELTLIVIKAEIATSVSAFDVANSNNGSDLRVMFNAAADETTVSSYRIIVVKSSLASSFDIVAANAVTLPNYMSVNPTGATIDTVLDITSVDSDGDLIANNIPYKVFVLSVADGVIASANDLALPSAEIVLTSTKSTDIATNIIATDISNNNDGSDLQVSFDKAADENGIAEYRIIVVKSANSSSFDTSFANNLADTNYLKVIPNGANIDTVLTNTSTDSDGDIIDVNIPYKLFVLSVADGINAGVNTLSLASNEITLLTNTSINTIDNMDFDIYSSDNSIIVNSNSQSECKIMIYDMSGKMLYNSNINCGTNRISVPTHSSGVYVAKIIVGNTIYSKKVFLTK